MSNITHVTQHYCNNIHKSS